jgi:hypothetical protein
MGLRSLFDTLYYDLWDNFCFCSGKGSLPRYVLHVCRRLFGVASVLDLVKSNILPKIFAIRRAGRSEMPLDSLPMGIKLRFQHALVQQVGNGVGAINPILVEK